MGELGGLLFSDFFFFSADVFSFCTLDCVQHGCQQLVPRSPPDHGPRFFPSDNVSPILPPNLDWT